MGRTSELHPIQIRNPSTRRVAAADTRSRSFGVEKVRQAKDALFYGWIPTARMARATA
jgi:hypothetical protein